MKRVLLFGYFIGFHIIMVKGQDVYQQFLSMEFEQALSELQVSTTYKESDKKYLEHLIHIWLNHGTSPKEDSVRAAYSDDINQAKTLLLEGSYNLFNRKRTDALPLLLEAIRVGELEESLSFICYLGIMEIYSKMYAIGKGYRKYLEELNDLSRGSDLKRAWYLIYQVKYAGAQAPGDSTRQAYLYWIQAAKDFYEQTSLPTNLKIYFQYEFGTMELLRQNFDESKKTLLQVIESGQDKPYLRHTVFNSYLQLARILSAAEQYDSAQYIFWQSLQFRPITDTLLFDLNYQNAIALSYYEKTGQYRAAYHSLKESVESIIPVFIEENNLWVADLLEQYEARRREEEINHQRGVLRWVFLSAILLLALLLTMILAYFRIKNKNHRIEMLMRELHHRVKNNLQIVSSLLGLQSRKLMDENAKEAVSEGKSRIRAMSLIHQRLYQKKEFTSINIKEYLSSLAQELVQAYGVQDQVELKLSIINETFDADSALPLGLIVNELLSNALKHALDQIDQPVLELTLYREESNYILLVADNGLGLDHTATKDSSFGLKLVGLLIKQIRGSLNILDKSGLTYRLEFKKSIKKN